MQYCYKTIRLLMKQQEFLFLAQQTSIFNWDLANHTQAVFFLRCFEGPKRSLNSSNGLSKYSDMRSHQWRTVSQIPPSGLLKFPCGHQSETLKKNLHTRAVVLNLFYMSYPFIKQDYQIYLQYSQWCSCIKNTKLTNLYSLE